MLTNDCDESGSESGGTPTTAFKGVNLDVMQRRISSLEDENKQLRTEFVKMASDADDCEAQEARLVKDIATQLG